MLMSSCLKANHKRRKYNIHQLSLLTKVSFRSDFLISQTASKDWACFFLNTPQFVKEFLSSCVTGVTLMTAKGQAKIRTKLSLSWLIKQNVETAESTICGENIMTHPGCFPARTSCLLLTQNNKYGGYFMIQGAESLLFISCTLYFQSSQFISAST